jgi:hypothetical protein
MDPIGPSDEVMDLIGTSAMRRQAAGEGPRGEEALGESLRQLNELLAREREAVQVHGVRGQHSANVRVLLEAVTKLKAP